MIDQVLYRERVLRLAKRLADTVAADGAEEGRSLEIPVEALAALAHALSDQPALRAAADPESRGAFIPTDLVLSLLQEAAEEYLRERQGGGVAESARPGGPLASERFATQGGPEGVDPFEAIDLRWVSGFLVNLAKHLGDRRRFRLPDSPPRPFELDDDARVVLVGDWGTGERKARAVAEQIARVLADAGDRQTHVVHLGDVYYAGTKKEARRRFLAYWPVAPEQAERHRSWCLNANHDMYASGEGLFEVILRDDRFAHQVTLDGSPTSEFQLRGAHWQILGLDSAWKLQGGSLDDLRGHAGFVGDEQVGWMTPAVEGGPPAILLSHHQPFSREGRGEEGIEPLGNLLEKTADLRRAGGLCAWFWGHEHRCMTYGPREGIGYPACVGHGAVPAAPKASYAEGDEWELTDTFVDDDGEEWRKPGFAILDFALEAVTVRYVDYEGALSKPPERFAKT